MDYISTKIPEFLKGPGKEIIVKLLTVIQKYQIISTDVNKIDEEMPEFKKLIADILNILSSSMRSNIPNLINLIDMFSNVKLKFEDTRKFLS